MAGRRSRRLLVVLVALTLLAVACTQDEEQAAETPAPDGERISLRAGMNDPDDTTIAVTEYLPEAIRVEEGTTVEWTNEGPEPHSITFLPPGEQMPEPESPEFFELFEPTPPEGPYTGTELVNSGLGPGGPEHPDVLTFEMTFAETGTFQYACVIHPLMTGTIHVVEEGEAVYTQEQIDERAEFELEGWLEEGREAKQALLEREVRQETEDGGTTWYVQMGATTAHTDILAFAPTPAEVEAGDRVVFINDSGAPHTATFLGEEEVPAVDDPEAEGPSGDPPLEVNATDYLNTGILPPNVPLGAGPPEEARSFAFDVPEEGEFDYVCILHVPSGMVGTIRAT